MKTDTEYLSEEIDKLKRDIKYLENEPISRECYYRLRPEYDRLLKENKDLKRQIESQRDHINNLEDVNKDMREVVFNCINDVPIWTTGVMFVFGMILMN